MKGGIKGFLYQPKFKNRDFSYFPKNLFRLLKNFRQKRDEKFNWLD